MRNRLKKALATMELDGVDSIPVQVSQDELRQIVEVLEGEQGGKYEYHYDHTDCIYYNSEEPVICPSQCAQYRDGWNDAMQYIYKNGSGYSPYKKVIRNDGMGSAGKRLFLQ